jgi:hypothetical protein
MVRATPMYTSRKSSLTWSWRSLAARSQPNFTVSAEGNLVFVTMSCHVPSIPSDSQASMILTDQYCRFCSLNSSPSFLSDKRKWSVWSSDIDGYFLWIWIFSFAYIINKLQSVKAGFSARLLNVHHPTVHPLALLAPLKILIFWEVRPSIAYSNLERTRE